MLPYPADHDIWSIPDPDNVDGRLPITVTLKSKSAEELGSYGFTYPEIPLVVGELLPQIDFSKYEKIEVDDLTVPVPTIVLIWFTLVFPINFQIYSANALLEQRRVQQ